MSDEYARSEKQSYLRDNIIEKGYDAAKFVEFMQSHKGIYLFANANLEGGDNIDVWTFEELKDIVDQFIQQNPLKPETKEEAPTEDTTAAPTTDPQSQPQSQPVAPSQPSTGPVLIVFYTDIWELARSIHNHCSNCEITNHAKYL